LTLDEKSNDIDILISDLSKMPEIDFVEKDYIREVFLT
jgi:hypothetical protein